MSLSWDIASCQGIPGDHHCKDCQRYTETNHNPYRQAWMVGPILAKGEVCTYKIKEST